VKKGGGRAILKHYTNGDKLGIHKLGLKQKLPNDLYAKWEGNDEQVISPKVQIVGQSIKGAESVVSGKTIRTAGIKESIVVEA
jgi:hypothetical protein